MEHVESAISAATLELRTMSRAAETGQVRPTEYIRLITGRKSGAEINRSAFCCSTSDFSINLSISGIRIWSFVQRITSRSLSQTEFRPLFYQISESQI
jgi:hypothetical protein